MEQHICSYCQRPYGIMINNRPLIRTFDHIRPRKGTQLSRKLTNDRRGVMMRGVNSLNEVDNLIQCCNQCNELKGDMSLLEFSARLELLSLQKRHFNPYYYLNSKIVKIIKNSINILLTTKPEPILIGIIE